MHISIRMPLTPQETWPGGAHDTKTAHLILIEYLAFMHGETVSHAALVRLLKNQYGWTDLSVIEDTLSQLVVTYDVIVKEDVFCCCAPVPCYRIREDCDSVRKIVELLATSPNSAALGALQHVKACL